MQDLRGAVVAIDPRNGDVLALVSTPAVRSESLRGRLEPRRLRRAEHGSRQAALQPRARGHLSAGLDGEAVPRARRAAARGDDARRRAVLPRALPSAGPDASLPRLAAAGPRQRRHARRDRAVVRRLLLSPRRRDGHRRAWRTGSRRSASARPTGLDISGENSGIVPSREWKTQQFTRREDQVWFPGETVITGIGQGYTLVTPVQLAHARRDARGARATASRRALLIGTENAVTREVHVHGADGAAERRRARSRALADRASTRWSA